MAFHSVSVGSVVVVLAEGEITLQDAHDITDMFNAKYRSGERYAVLLDARGVSAPSAQVRRVLGESEGDDAEIEQDRGQHVAVVLSSTVLRGVLTAVQWFLPRAVRLAPVATVQDGMKHLATVGHPRADTDAARLKKLAYAVDEGWAARRDHNIDLDRFA